MSDIEREKRVDDLWRKARKYNNKIRFQVRIAKMAEQNQKEMMIDEHIDGEDDWMKEHGNQKLAWYMLDVDSTFIKAWNFFITLVLIYELIMNPFIQVFPEVYQTKNAQGVYEAVTGQH